MNIIRQRINIGFCYWKLTFLLAIFARPIMPLIFPKTLKMLFGKFVQESRNHVLQDEHRTQKLSQLFWQDPKEKFNELVCALGFAFLFFFVIYRIA